MCWLPRVVKARGRRTTWQRRRLRSAGWHARAVARSRHQRSYQQLDGVNVKRELNVAWSRTSAAAVHGARGLSSQLSETVRQQGRLESLRWQGTSEHLLATSCRCQRNTQHTSIYKHIFQCPSCRWCQRRNANKVRNEFYDEFQYHSNVASYSRHR